MYSILTKSNDKVCVDEIYVDIRLGIVNKETNEALVTFLDVDGAKELGHLLLKAARELEDKM
jgi:hypothetical protein